jgi:hypothetical protein
MAHLALFSFSAGMTHEQRQALVSGEREPVEHALKAATGSMGTEPDHVEKVMVGASAGEPPTKARRRARTDRGAFKADDPTTPDTNEAYEPEREN